ncbi:MAG TPA: CopG family transcriptional regulator [Chloroflexota bacterium]
MSTTSEELAVVTLHIPTSMKDQLDRLAHVTGRQQGILAIEAIGRYLEVEADQIAEIQDAVQRADAGDFALEDQVTAVRNKFRTLSTG